MSEHVSTLPQLVTGYWISKAIHAAAEFDFAAQLQERPKSAAELAEATGTHPESTLRLLRALASIGIFRQREDGKFTMTPLADELARPAARAFSRVTGETFYPAWTHLSRSITTGEPAFDHAFGKPVFQYFAENPEKAEIFDAAMTGVHGPETVPMTSVTGAGVGALVACRCLTTFEQLG